jgi:succinate dehydrogenase / fumarate reductase membrane anchor subunit
MVTNITSLTGNGLKDWLIQRATAIYFAAYCIFLLAFVILHPQMGYTEWSSLFHRMDVKIATLIALGAFAYHTWIGIWTVTTDYIKCTVIRLSLQMIIILFLLFQFLWGFMIVWGQ